MLLRFSGTACSGSDHFCSPPSGQTRRHVATATAGRRVPFDWVTICSAPRSLMLEGEDSPALSFFPNGGNTLCPFPKETTLGHLQSPESLGGTQGGQK